MKKVIALMGSPRIGSNTDILTDKVIEGLLSRGKDNNLEVEKINMIDYKECVCVGCGKCRATGKCMESDKVNEVLEKIKDTDGLIISTPTWWMAESSYLKIFMDHFGAFLNLDYSSRIAGKKAAIVACNANPDINFAEQVCRKVEDMLKFLGVEVKGTLGVKGLLDIGAVSNNQEALNSAYKLGEKLYSKSI